MSTHEVKVICITEVLKHPNADALELIPIWDYVACTRLGDFKVGDLAAYIEPDYVVPDTEQFSFLKGKRRIKCKRLRGIMSQGLLIKAPEGSQEGDNVMEQLGIIRYVPPEKPWKCMGGGTFKGTTKLGTPPPGINSPKYGLENYRKNTWMIKEGDLVEISEKIHGCVKIDASITMADGSKKQYRHVQIGDEILGVDAFGNLVTTKVLNKFSNGPAEEGWLKIEGPRYSAGKGPSRFTLTCTPNHEIWSASKNTYVHARDLKIGEKLLTSRTDLALPKVMQYKLPEYYRGSAGWLPLSEGKFKPNLIEISIDSIKTLSKKEVKSNKFDMETETHNYFAHGVLVHNCNARYVYHEDKMWVGSHNSWRDQSDQDAWWVALSQSPWIETWCKSNPGYVLYGEIYGSVQDLEYGMPKDQLGFKAFDIFYEGRGLSMEAFNNLVPLECRPPLLYSGPFNKEILLSLVDGKTTMPGADHLREGVVISKYNIDITGNTKLKYVSDEYLSRQ